jgi:hypothetical protein
VKLVHEALWIGMTPVIDFAILYFYKLQEKKIKFAAYFVEAMLFNVH